VAGLGGLDGGAESFPRQTPPGRRGLTNRDALYSGTVEEVKLAGSGFVGVGEAMVTEGRKAQKTPPSFDYPAVGKKDGDKASFPPLLRQELEEQLGSKAARLPY